MSKSKDLEFREHLNDLRKRFIISLVYFVLVLMVSFFFVPEILLFLQNTSSGVEINLNVFSVTDSLYLYMRIAGMSALIISMPFFLWQMWLFIKPGLEKTEIKFVRRHFPIVIILFFLGISFSYAVIIPYYVIFSTNLANANGLNSVIGAREYIDFIVKTVWPFGFAFQLPMIIHILSSIGLVNYILLKKIRGYAYVGLMIISAFLTPPDPISMGIMLIPLAILYESSVIIAKRNNKKRQIKVA